MEQPHVHSLSDDVPLDRIQHLRARVERIGSVGARSSLFGGRRGAAVKLRVMSEALEFLTLSHLNAIVDGYDSAIEHFVGVFGATLNMEIPDDVGAAVPDDPDARACLVSLGGVLYNFFAPNDRNAERGRGRLLGRYGDHYVGAEYSVPNLAEARERCHALGIKIISDEGRVFFTYGGSCHGISWEVFNRDWHDVLVEGSERYARPGTRAVPMPSQRFWRDEHPLGLTGLVRIGSAVEDLDEAVATFRRLVGAEELYRADRPTAAGHAVGLELGDTVVELLAPTGPGPLREYLDRYGERIRSTVYGVVDLGRVETYFAERGIPLVPGDAPGVLAIPPEHNHNLLFEFSEESSTHPW